VDSPVDVDIEIDVESLAGHEVLVKPAEPGQVLVVGRDPDLETLALSRRQAVAPLRVKARSDRGLILREVDHDGAVRPDPRRNPKAERREDPVATPVLQRPFDRWHDAQHQLPAPHILIGEGLERQLEVIAGRPT
jgi:hypothetical protein